MRRTLNIDPRRGAARHRRNVVTGVLLCAGAVGCHEYRPIAAPVNTVTPVRVQLPGPRPIVLRRQRPDSILEGVRSLEGTLVLIESDSMRIDVTRAESNGRWRDVAAPAEATIALQPGTVVERRVVSRRRTMLAILGGWLVLGAAVVGSL